jgi:glycosidase
VQPWMNVVGNYHEINLKDQLNDPQSVFRTYQAILHQRKEDDIAFGDITFIDLKSEDFYIYKNVTSKATYFVVANFTKDTKELNLKEDFKGYDLLFQNYQDTVINHTMVLRPYEAFVLRKK